MRTISVSPINPTGPEYDDLDGLIVSGIDALRQRIVQAIRFRARTWFIRRNAGLDYDTILGHRISPDLAAAVLNDTIREEGGDEVLNLRDVHFSLDSPSRVFSYSVTVETIYGDMTISEG